MSTTLIRVPHERASQLRLLADHKRVPVTELISQLVAAEIARLDLTRKIGLGQDIDVCLLENGDTWVSAAGLGNFSWTRPVADAVADAIDRVAVNRGAVMDMDAGVQIDRVGTSVRLKNINDDGERTFALSVASDLARLIRATAR